MSVSVCYCVLVFTKHDHFFYLDGHFRHIEITTHLKNFANDQTCFHYHFLCHFSRRCFFLFSYFSRRTTDNVTDMWAIIWRQTTVGKLRFMLFSQLISQAHQEIRQFWNLTVGRTTATENQQCF